MSDREAEPVVEPGAQLAEPAVPDSFGRRRATGLTGYLEACTGGPWVGGAAMR